MVESTTYKDSVLKGELVPQITLNSLEKPEEEWSVWEVIEIVQKSASQFTGDMAHNAVSTRIFSPFLHQQNHACTKAMLKKTNMKILNIVIV